MKEQILFEQISSSEGDLKGLVQKMKTFVQTPSLLLLSGEVGAGKTTWTRYFCEEYFINQVQSPTYAIYQKYESLQMTVHHFDLYRIQSEDDLASTGFWDLLQDPTGIKLIEWSEKIKETSWFESYLSQYEVYHLKISLNEELSIRTYQFLKYS